MLSYRPVPPHPGTLRLLITIWLLFTLAACSADMPMEPVTGRLRPDGQSVSGAVPPVSFQGPLTVLTLNVAHGRGTAFSQILQKGDAARENLARVTELLRTSAADIVALQEADGPSRWSGNMDHVAILADGAGFPWYARASHVSNWMATYGTAILAQRPFAGAGGYTFQPSPPTLNKGFVWGRFNWQPDPADDTVIPIDVVSVHLDFSRQSVRTGQIEEMSKFLAGREHPVIILGDFNSQWFAEDSVVKALSSQAGLVVYQPRAEDLGTYGAKNHRLDWILISNHLEFTRYGVLPDIVSDHKAVLAEVSLKKERS